MSRVLGFEWTGRKVLVTGGSGFKGAWLSEALRRLGATVCITQRAFDNPHSAYHLFGLRENVSVADIDITSYQDVTDLLNRVRPDIIFNLAAISTVPNAYANPHRTVQTNVEGPDNLIQACRLLGVGERVIIVSTDHVFGHSIPENEFVPGGKFEKGIEEHALVSFGGPYDTSKAMMELWVRQMHYTYWDKLPAIAITRMANVWGFGDVGHRRVMPLFVTQATQGDKQIGLKYRLNGRQFIHITDAIAGYIRAASSLDEPVRGSKTTGNYKPEPMPESRVPFTTTFHFAQTDYGKFGSLFIRMRDLAGVVADCFGATVVETPDCQDFATNENRIQGLNCTKTKKVLDWSPKAKLTEEIEKLGEWYASLNSPKDLRNMLYDDMERILRNVRE